MKTGNISALYERLSHNDELQGESNSISNQKRMLMDYAKQHGLPHPVHYTDDGISVTRFDRPGFMAMMDEVSRGNIGTICVKDMSRLGRDHLKVGQIVEILWQRASPVNMARHGQGLNKNRSFPDLYNWCSLTVVQILRKAEYLGHTVNFKTETHFRTKKVIMFLRITG